MTGAFLRDTKAEGGNLAIVSLYEVTTEFCPMCGPEFRPICQPPRPALAKERTGNCHIQSQTRTRTLYPVAPLRGRANSIRCYSRSYENCRALTLLAHVV